MTIVRRKRYGRRRPDFAGCDPVGGWSLVEAKGRTDSGALMSTRRQGLEQVRAVDLDDRWGQRIDLVARVSCVARLSGSSITVFADDPPSDEVRTVYRIAIDRMISDYYALPRQLAAAVGRRGPGLSGAEQFIGVALLGEDLVLGVHRQMLEALDDVDALLDLRATLQGELRETQAEAVEREDLALSVGLDGLALASRGSTTHGVLYGYADRG